MEPEIDIYQECFCGSGKKLKFCCAPIASEMVKIIRMREQHQSQMALQALENLEKKPITNVWSRAWILVNKALVLETTNQEADILPLLDQVLADLPEHPIAIALKARTMVMTSEFQEARADLYKAFRFAVNKNTAAIAVLAATVGAFLAAKGSIMAGSRLLSFARALDSRESILEQWLQVVTHARSQHMHYALYSHHELRPCTPATKALPDLQSAQELADRECWGEAAVLFEKVARQKSGQEAADLWHNTGLAYAFGDEPSAAVAAFRAAAKHGADFELAVDDESLAQALESSHPDQRVPVMATEFHVRSVSRLLTLLDQQPLFVRGDSEDEEFSGVYQIVDRTLERAVGESRTIANMPIVLAEVRVIDVHEGHDHPATASLIVWPRPNEDAESRKQHVAEMTQKFREIADAELEPGEAEHQLGSRPAEVTGYEPSWVVDPNLTWKENRALQKERIHRLLHEIWPNRPLAALGGKTPHEVIGREEHRLALAAAIVMLDGYFEISSWLLDEDLLRNRYGLPSIDTSNPVSLENLSGISLLELRHMPLMDLTDANISIIANRLNLTPHSRLLYNVLVEVLGRPTLLAKNSASRLYVKLSQLCYKRFSPEEARAWMGKARQEAQTRKAPLEEMLDLDLNEITIRLVDEGSDPHFLEFVHQVWNRYSRKLPEVRETLANFLSMSELVGPWNNPQAAADASSQLAGSTTPGGIWTPESAPAAQGSKLWLPGQE